MGDNLCLKPECTTCQNVSSKHIPKLMQDNKNYEITNNQGESLYSIVKKNEESRLFIIILWVIVKKQKFWRLQKY
ncbi:unnamed protein product [Blepharisma stoltei]|uniref:Uncharacterized protein n=1 Tax=Blepharisma stoltei TaxID=1481888 RepID=A0AAU9KL51_9CILI|nr:unnamed protein product [Blepharisma stoltei]